MESKHHTDETMEALLKELKLTNRFLKKQVSFRKSFIKGIFHGLGAVLGATVVLSVFLSVFIWSLSQLQFIPLIGNFAFQIVQFVQESSKITKSTPDTK